MPSLRTSSAPSPAGERSARAVRPPVEGAQLLLGFPGQGPAWSDNIDVTRGLVAGAPAQAPKPAISAAPDTDTCTEPHADLGDRTGHERSGHWITSTRSDTPFIVRASHCCFQ